MEEKRRKKFARIGRSAIGPGFVFLLLVGYFVWLAQEMGGAATTGARPLVAMFAATAVAMALAGAGIMLARRERDKS
jgi:hypothetical protein